MIASPFPGMDPYLEAPDIWHSLHTRGITILADQLTSALAPTYIANLETDIVIDYVDSGATGGSNGGQTEGRPVVAPDVAVRKPASPATDLTLTRSVAKAPLQLRVPMPVERRLTRIRIIHRERKILVAVIELLSPVNKRPGEKRQKYLEKRAKYLESSVHLIEIDLLRQWQRMPLEGELPACDYLILVSDAHQRPEVDVWPLRVRDPLLLIPVPLLYPDPPVMADLGEVLRIAYPRARYDLQINYHQPPKPALSPQDAQWAAELIARQATREE